MQFVAASETEKVQRKIQYVIPMKFSHLYCPPSAERPLVHTI